MLTHNTNDTIAAIATPPGRGGVGIIRLSGPDAKQIATTIAHIDPKPRYAHFANFIDQQSLLIDQGLMLFFKAPHSFTGEDVIELHGHGGPVVMDNLLKRCLHLGARLARPGEFSERAFLNDKIDLTQAEAIADLIDCGTQKAARAAMNSLQGEFSKRINQLLTSLIQLRMYVEAAIDFPEEELDLLSDGKVAMKLADLMATLNHIKQQAKQGSLLREGMSAVLIGQPNVGKSSLLNRLSGKETAIVTDIPGTTRDILRDNIEIDGIPLHIIDTAGLRDSPDQIELEGIRRAKDEIKRADLVLWVLDSQAYVGAAISTSDLLMVIENYASDKPVTIILNKIDLSNKTAGIEMIDDNYYISLSAKTGEGMEYLYQHLKNMAGIDAEFDGAFLARRRHLTALDKVMQALTSGQQQLRTNRAGELLAEDLRQAQLALSEITGEFTSDDLLGEIFQNFCIGK